MTPQDFIAAISPAAKTSALTTKIPASFTIAQAALESAWGAHCPGFNLFGIKADPSWHGPVTSQVTHEVVNGQTIEITAKFRAYPNWLASLEDHAQFLLKKVFIPVVLPVGAMWTVFRVVNHETLPDWIAAIIKLILAVL